MARDTPVDCCAPERGTVSTADEADPTNDDRASGQPSDRSTPTFPEDDRLVDLDGGTFLMGTDDEEYPADGEGPVREVTVDPFRIDRYAVTNAEFLAFVRDTDYLTDAERYGWSFVFDGLLDDRARNHAVGQSNAASWWVGVEGACWYRPEGPGSSVLGRLDHPVVHVSHRDARAFCEWAGRRLPTEAEWEYAARGGLTQRRFPWGDDPHPEGEHRCNIWQGEFPTTNTAADGFVGTAPVDAFPTNGFGLANVAGNVWEWCMDWFSPTHHVDGPRENPTGPPDGNERVIRGGSYLCHDSYCNRYRVAARTANTPDSTTGHVGFRTVADP